MIAAVKAAVRIPVMGNGDIASGADARAMLAETGCDGLMIGRGALGNPWLFRTAGQALRGETVTPETLRERVDAALQHLEWMTAYKGERLGVQEMRKHIGHYVGGVRGASALRREMNSAGTTHELRALLEKLWRDADGWEEP